MRVIGGEKRGFKLFSPASNATRPMLDRVKEAVFNMIQFDLGDAGVLDLFAGSGSLGIESMSRGAKSTVFIEKSMDACELLKKNVEKTGFASRSKVIAGDVLTLLSSPILRQDQFKIIFMDPPYPMMDEDKKKIFEIIDQNSLLEGFGKIILHQEKARDVITSDRFELIKDKLYGTSRILIYRGALNGDTNDGEADNRDNGN